MDGHHELWIVVSLTFVTACTPGLSDAEPGTNGTSADSGTPPARQVITPPGASHNSQELARLSLSKFSAILDESSTRDELQSLRTLLSSESLAGPPPSNVLDTYREARGLAASITKRFADDPLAHIVAARIHTKAGYHRIARAHWARAIELESDSPEPWIELGRLAEHDGDFESALACLEEALAIRPNEKAVVLALASSLKLNNRLPEASAILSDFLAESPNQVEALEQLANLKLATGDWSEAKQISEQVTTIAPSSRRGHISLTTAALQLGQDEVARKHKEIAEKLAQENESSILISRADPEGDLRGQRAAISTLYVQAADLYLRRQQFEQGVALCHRALQFSPFQVEARQILDELYSSAGRWEEAAALYQDAIEAEPENSTYWMNLASRLANAGKFDRAEEVWLDSLRRFESSPEVISGYAVFLMQVRNNFEEAERRLLDLNEAEESASNWALIAQARRFQSNLDAASQAAAAAIRLEPENPIWHQLQQAIDQAKRSENPCMGLVTHCITWSFPAWRACSQQHALDAVIHPKSVACSLP